MDKLTSMNLSFDRVLIQIIIPGLISVYPFVLIYLQLHPNAKLYLYNNSTVLIAFMTFLSLIAGLFLENFGARIETSWYDKVNSAKDKEYKQIWEKFLQLRYDPEPVGHRYLRNILLRMKFELSTSIALLIMDIGLFIINDNKPIFSNIWLNILLVFLLPIGTSFYLLCYEAKSSSKVLARVRRVLVEQYWTIQNS